MLVTFFDEKCRYIYKKFIQSGINCHYMANYAAFFVAVITNQIIFLPKLAKKVQLCGKSFYFVFIADILLELQSIRASPILVIFLITKKGGKAYK